MKDFKGYIQVYTGNGKGKTTASLGLSLRAAGNGMKVFIAQFMKKRHYSELDSIRKYLGDYIRIEQFGIPDFHYTGGPVTDEERDAALDGIKRVKEIIRRAEHQVLVLDEVNVLLYYKIIDINTVLEILDSRPDNIEFILTGRYAPEEIIKRADLVTEMREIRHYYEKGVEARPGIEK